MRTRLIVAALAFAAGAGFPGMAHAQICAGTAPHLTGEWVTLPYQMPINPINATLLRSGRVLIVAGSENDARNNSEGSESYRAALWDPAGIDQSSITVDELTYDVFCSGTATLPDGRALVVGGTSDYTFTGESRASFFDPLTKQWVQSQNMVDGRWYATATTLADGRVMAFSGIRQTGGTSNTVEIYDLNNAGPGWLNPVAAPFTPPLYPRMTLLPNGKVFYSGQGSGGTNPTGWIFDPVPRTWTASTAITQNRSYGTSVILPLLPPSYIPKVMNFGGNSPATDTTEIIDLSVASPVWTPGPVMSTGRIQMDAVILPNGKVLALGGSVNNEAPNGPGKAADLYDPISNTFSSAGVASYSRLYHSAALLLPDARVMSIGSNPANRGTYLAAIEIYTPAYLFDSADRLITTGRPAITGISPASGTIGYGAQFSVTYTASSPISSAVLVRPGSVTHAFDMEQRLIGLCGPSPQPPCSGSGTLTLTAPTSGGVAPPGYYMLFLLDSAGVPSKAQFIQLARFGTAPPLGAIASPATDLTIPAGSSVSFGTATAAAKYSWVFPGGTPTTSTAQTPGNVTFNTPGRYTTSLTVIDAVGNSDPSPPTRTVTVTPSTPDFHISVSPSGRLVNPGQPTTFTVSVTPVSGFAGPVTLDVSSESAFPSGVTSGGFSPSTITGSGSSTLTMNTTGSAVPYALSLTVTGTSGTLTHTTSTTLMVTLAAPATLSATPGQRAGVAVVGDIGRGVWLPGEALDSERRSVRGGGLLGGHELHRHRPHQRHDLPLRRLGDLHRWTRRGRCERQLESGQCHATSTPAPAAHRPRRDAGQRPGVAELDRLVRSDELQREARDRVRRAVHHGRQHRRDELHQYRAHQRHDLLLRGHRGERVRGERELHAGERHASGVVPAPPDGGLGDAWQRPGLAELDRLVRRDELQREALDRVRRAVHHGRQHRRDELHQHRAHQRHDLFLRRHRGERLRRERELHPGERHASECRTGSAHPAHRDPEQARTAHPALGTVHHARSHE